jgi:ribose/xylose/arabinose/galactoside ABC-type transport system permease subunit
MTHKESSRRMATGQEAGSTQASRFETTRTSLGGLSPVIVVLVLLIFFSLTAPMFFTVGNLVNVLKQMAVVGVLGVGMTLVVLIGGIDLSVGSVVLLSGAITGTLVYNYAFNPLVAILAGMLAGLAVGFVNGVLTERVGISPVIVTLGTLIAVRGLGQAILWINNSWIWVTDPAFVYIAEGRILAVPVIALIMLALYLLASLMLTRTSPGRYIYAIGGNERAALLNGLPVLRTKITVYMLCGLTAAIAGILTASRTGVVGPSVGTGLEFDAITAVVLGGTRLTGGIGRVERTLLGTAMLVMVLNYLTIRGVPDVWQTSVTGFLILAAVLIDRLARRGTESR